MQRNPEPGRMAVIWLATAFVLAGGAAFCTFIVVVATEDPSWHLMAMGGLFAGIVLLLWMMSGSRDRHSGNAMLRLWMKIRGKSDPKTVLRIGRKKSSSGAALGTNAPPTLESVREAAEQKISWVPHGPPPERSRRSR